MVSFSEIIDIHIVSRLWVRQIYITTNDVQMKHEEFFRRLNSFSHHRIELACRLSPCKWLTIPIPLSVKGTPSLGFRADREKGSW